MMMCVGDVLESEHSKKTFDHLIKSRIASSEFRDVCDEVEQVAYDLDRYNNERFPLQSNTIEWRIRNEYCARKN